MIKVIIIITLEQIKIIYKFRRFQIDKRSIQNFYPPKGGEVMVEMLVDCIIFLAVTYISSIQLEI